MGANLTRCPPAGTLERLLAEDLPGPERDSVETHVETCTPCQGELARLSATGPQSVVPLDEVPDTSAPQPSAGFLERLREWPTRSGDRPTGPGGRVGRYEILERVAAGGMGVVYRARHLDLGKVVALKVLPAGGAGEVHVARFRQEMRAVGGLAHAHIVTAHDAGEADGVHYLAMEFVDGADLGRLVRAHGRLGVADACAAVRQAALGLQHAHERGLVHRDVKPSNLMLARGGLVQVLDLGLARAADAADRLTATGALLGTADYLAPEQWDRPQAADIRADVYGLGCTLYHLLAGRPPFAGERYGTAMARMRGHHDDPPPPIAGVPPALAAVLDRMLAKDPADRCQTPAEVAQALQPFAAGADLVRLLDAGDVSDSAPAAAVTPGLATRETSAGSHRPRPRPARRRPVVFAAAVVVLLAVVAAGLLWPKRDPGTAPAAKPVEIANLRMTHYRDSNDGAVLLGDLRTSTAAVHVKDGVALAASFNTPAYYYVIAFNPAGSADGVEQLCSPEGPDGKGAGATRPEPGAEIRYPRDGGVFWVDAPGLQVFVLAASSKPLPPYDEWKQSARDVPWAGDAAPGKLRWHYDGREFDWFPKDRGQVTGAPPALAKLRDWFKARPEFEAVQVFAFPVTAD